MGLANELEEMGVKVNDKIAKDNSTLYLILMYGGTFLLIVFGMRFLSKRMDGEAMMGGMGGNRAKVYMEKQTGVTFRDVAGQDEAKESLSFGVITRF